MNTLNNFKIVNTDTDSITVCKPDYSPYSEEERQRLLNELNSLYPKEIQFSDDGYFECVIVFKAKNYILWDGNKLKLKGSSLKDSKKEPALREFMEKCIWDLILHDGINLVDIYHKYILEALNPTDITRWAQKKTLTKAILACEESDIPRPNEKVLWNAIKDKGLSEGDKFWIYPAIISITKTETVLKNGKTKTKISKDSRVKSIEDFAKDHDSEKLVERVHTTLKIMQNVIDFSKFVDYTLIKNKSLLEKLIDHSLKK